MPGAPTAIGTFAYSLANNDPGKDRPANALVPAQPGKAAGGSCDAPSGTLNRFADFDKRAPFGAARQMAGRIMPAMTDPSEALLSFQQALARNEIVGLQKAALDGDLFVHLDRPAGTTRFTYVRLDRKTVTAIVMAVDAGAIDGVPVFQLGCAVPPSYRNQGRAKSIISSAIAELRHGLARNKITAIYIEAIVGTDNEASKRVAAATISSSPSEITDSVSGLPALQYLHKYEL